MFGLITGFHATLLFVVVYFSVFCSTFFILIFLQNIQHMKNPKNPKKYSVTIIIPAHNEEAGIAATIKSALSINYPKRLLEIMVIENGESKDKTYAIAKKFEKFGVKVFQLKKAGKGHALNYGIKKAKGEIIITMDADTYIRDKDILHKVLSYFSNPEIFSVAPAIRPAPPKTLAQRIQYVEYVFGIFLRKVFSLIDAVYVTPGAFTAYRKVIFKKVGYFDDNNITEDFEMTLRIQKQHFRIANVIDAMVYTNSPDNFSDLMKQRVRWFLGFIDCLIIHKSLFHVKHGYLGIFILPSAIISITLSLALFLFSIGKLIFETVKFFTRASVSDFYNMYKFTLYNIKFDSFFYSASIVDFVVVILFLLGVFIFFAARKYSKDQEKFAISFFFYIALYVFLFASWWIKTLLYKLAGKDLRFGGVVWNNNLISKLTNRVS
jgi:cellulose synthase/poly-beta-1,6-N-acetylglucosamine synthase-like glycosyltransferase